MGTGWRRAFCNTLPRDKRDVDKQQSPLAGSNPSTPRLRCRTTTTTPTTTTRSENVGNNNVHLVGSKSCSTTPKSHSKSPRNLFTPSNPSSPRSPFSILKNTLRLSRSSCGVCMQSVKSGQRTAIYTAECSHVFHFPCITSHVTTHKALICPVCNTIWKDVPFLSLHHHQQTTPTPSPKYTSTKPPPQNYSDDQPLFTPKATIPEATKDGGEEFRGFFASGNDAFASNRSDNSRSRSVSVSVSLLPEAAVISAGRTHVSYAVVLKVKAPPPPRTLDAARRAPIDLVTVLDVSLSMSGAKLEMMKRAMRLVVSSLGSSDRLSIIAFSSTPKRLLPLMKMNTQGQRLARLIIDRLACSQGTSMAEALKQATKVLEDRRERNPVATIILLSDGQEDDNAIPPNNNNNHPSSTPVVHPTGRFSREPTEDAFSKCVGELLSVVVQDLTIQIGFATGEITGLYSANGPPTVFTPEFIRIGDLYAEEEREFLVEIRIPNEQRQTQHQQHQVLSVRCNYMDPANNSSTNYNAHALVVPRAQTVSGRSGSSSSKVIERLRNVFISRRAVAEARRLVEEHDEVSSAMELLSSARGLLLVQSRSSSSSSEYVRVLEAEMAEVLWRRQYQRQVMEQQQMGGGLFVDDNGEQLTPTSAWRAAENQAKYSVSDLHGFENARF